MYLKCFKQFVNLSLRDMSVFRSDFILSIVHLMVYQGIFIIFWQAIIRGIGRSIGQWHEADLALLVLSGLIFTSVKLVFFGFTTMSEKVLSGDIDKYLCRPISPLFALIAEDMKIWESFHSLLTCCLLFVILAIEYNFSISVQELFYFALSITLGSLMMIIIEGTVALSSFWLGDIRKISYTMNSFSDFQRYPLSILPSVLQFFLTWILPIGLVSTVPVLLLTGKITNVMGLFVAQLLGVMFWLTLFTCLWRKALVRYDSMGG